MNELLENARKFYDKHPCTCNGCKKGATLTRKSPEELKALLLELLVRKAAGDTEQDMDWTIRQLQEWLS